MVGPYSTLEEFKKHWPTLPSDLHEVAVQKIEEASVIIAALFPDTDTRIEEGVLAPATVRLVVNQMVKRVLDTSGKEIAGVTSATAQAGAFAQTLNFANPDATMYITSGEKRMLRTGRNDRQAWTIHPATAPRRMSNGF